ncbi:hypothetical protein EPK99_24975 [Neorhizobium lilium]|uniref:Uncharacterized protein n=1 Tax=Neorhizobium lilium TaxID=2503024 RepID=A0A3S3RD81_9HYPH|nr:hypothetical protein [Neorhizobium lilium]RWX74440.1 hypothetical protein EPK99_24975 [Neorhizobium lilium]
MTSDNGHSRQQKIERLIRLSEGKKPAEIDKELAVEYDPTPDEVEAIKAFLAGRRLPQYKALNGIIKLVIDHPRQEIGMAVLMQAMGISDERLFYGFIAQLTNAVSSDGVADITALNTAIATVAGIEPRDNLEATLAVQMATVHVAAMRHSRLMLTADTVERLELQERTVNKLMRTFTSQMEALRKHRNGGSQKVVVEHVHVHEGGQAIVGNVTHGGAGRKEKGSQSHEQQDLSVSTSASVLSHIEAHRMPMPSASGEGKARVPLSRGEGRGAKG